MLNPCTNYNDITSEAATRPEIHQKIRKYGCFVLMYQEILAYSIIFDLIVLNLKFCVLLRILKSHD